MDTGHLNVTASCIAHLFLIDAEAGKGKGRERCWSGGLEWHSAVGRRIGVAGTRRSHVSGVAVRVHDVGRAGIDITGSVGVARIVVTRTVAGIRTVAITGVAIAIARIAVAVAIVRIAVAITQTVPQAKSAEAEETRVETPVPEPSTPIEATTHAAATAPAESASTHVTTATAAVATSTTATATATAVRDRRGS